MECYKPPSPPLNGRASALTSRVGGLPTKKPSGTIPTLHSICRSFHPRFTAPKSGLGLTSIPAALIPALATAGGHVRQRVTGAVALPIFIPVGSSGPGDLTCQCCHSRGSVLFNSHHRLVSLPSKPCHPVKQITVARMCQSRVPSCHSISPRRHGC